MSTNNISKNQTYLSLGNEDSGLIEIDLVTMPQKNEEVRYLGFTFTGVNIKTNEKQEGYITLESKEQFDTLKNFFAQLEWNS